MMIAMVKAMALATMLKLLVVIMNIGMQENKIVIIKTLRKVMQPWKQGCKSCHVDLQTGRNAFPGTENDAF